MQPAQVTSTNLNGARATKERTHSTARMALKVLGLFTEAEPVLGVLEISRRLGVHKSKASRLVRALAAEEFLMRTSNRRYCLGYQIYSIGSLNQSLLVEAARSELYQIQQLTKENVHLGILVGTQLVLIERVYTERLIKYFLTSGANSPVHAVSMGKALLAHSSAETCQRVINGGLRRYTPRTITDGEAFRRELGDIRTRGYALDREEFRPGRSSVAVPILGGDGQTNVAIAIVAPTSELEGVALDKAVVVLKQAVARIASKAALRRRSSRA